MKRLGFAILLALAVLAGVGCSQDKKVPLGQAEVEVDPGSRVLIGDTKHGLRLAKGKRNVGIGTQVKVLAGRVSVALDDGSHLELTKGGEVDLGSPPSLVANDLLVTSGNDPVKVAVAGSEVTVNGVARMKRDLAVTVATYRGRAEIRSAARTLVVPALRQAEVPSLGVLPAETEALTYNTDDVWDRRYLGEAIDLAEQLESRAKGFTSSLRPGEGRTPGFYRLLIPALANEPGFSEDFLVPERDPGDTLIGAAIAVSGTHGSFSERWAKVFGFKAQGATWGLVAFDQEVTDTSALVKRVDEAIGAQSFAFAPTTTPAPALTRPAPAPVANVASPAPVTPSQAPTPRLAPAPIAAPDPGPQPLLQLPPLLPGPNPGDRGLVITLVDDITTALGGLLLGP